MKQFNQGVAESNIKFGDRNNYISKSTTELFCQIVTKKSKSEREKKCILRSYKNEPILEDVILPVLFARNIAIRRPTEDERQRIKNKLLIDDDEENFHEEMFKLTGIKKDNHSFVLESKSAISNESKIYGAITYSYEENNSQKICTIHSLQIHPKYKGLKFGSLLLDSVLLEAKKKRCQSVKLASSAEGLPLYLSVGFVPRFFDSDIDLNLDSWWGTLSLEEQVKGLSFCDPGFLLVFEIEKHSEKVVSQLKQALNCFKKESSHPMNLDHVKVHSLFFEKGILDLDNFKKHFKNKIDMKAVGSAYKDGEVNEKEETLDHHLFQMDFEAYTKEHESTERMDDDTDEFTEFLTEHDKRYPRDDLDSFVAGDDDGLLQFR